MRGIVSYLNRIELIMKNANGWPFVRFAAAGMRRTGASRHATRQSFPPLLVVPRGLCAKQIPHATYFKPKVLPSPGRTLKVGRGDAFSYLGADGIAKNA